MGTRFYASIEALGHKEAKERIVNARGDETKRTRVFDVARGIEWPEDYTGRALRNRFLERWDDQEEELAAALDTEGPAFREAMATELVWRIGVEAEACLRSGNGLLDEMGSARWDSNLRPSDTD